METMENYNDIYENYVLLDDEQLINRWKFHQRQSKNKLDYDCIAYEVCEDLLRQRGNTYIDERYPRD